LEIIRLTAAESISCRRFIGCGSLFESYNCPGIRFAVHMKHFLLSLISPGCHSKPPLTLLFVWFHQNLGACVPAKYNIVHRLLFTRNISALSSGSFRRWDRRTAAILAAINIFQSFFHASIEPDALAW